MLKRFSVTVEDVKFACYLLVVNILWFFCFALIYYTGGAIYSSSIGVDFGIVCSESSGSCCEEECNDFFTYDKFAISCHAQCLRVAKRGSSNCKEKSGGDGEELREGKECNSNTPSSCLNYWELYRETECE